MLERFNFYDLYAYLLPGLLVLGLGWLPYMLTGGALPEGGLSEGLVVVAAAYVAGHVVQTFAKELWSSSIAWSGDARVYPTSTLLSDDDTTIAPGIKKELKLHLADKLKVDFKDSKAAEDAWRLCRTSLKARKGASYVEQFHGMYNFMKGAATAFAYAAPYYLGWAIGMTWNAKAWTVPIRMALPVAVAVTFGVLSFWKRVRSWAPYVSGCAAAVALASPMGWTAVHVILVIAVGLLTWRQVISFFRLFRKPTGGAGSREKHVPRFSLASAVMAGAVLLGVQKQGDGLGPELLLLAAVAWVVAVQCAGSYHSFAKDFAAAIYRDYWAVVNGPSPKGGGDE